MYSGIAFYKPYCITSAVDGVLVESGEEAFTESGFEDPLFCSVHCGPKPVVVSLKIILASNASLNTSRRLHNSSVLMSVKVPCIKLGNVFKISFNVPQHQRILVLLNSFCKYNKPYWWQWLLIKSIGVSGHHNNSRTSIGGFNNNPQHWCLWMHQ